MVQDLIINNCDELVLEQAAQYVGLFRRVCDRKLPTLWQFCMTGVCDRHVLGEFD